MNTVKDLLELALEDGPAAERSVDPAGDLANGRRLLRRRRLAAGGGIAAAAAVGALVPVILSGGSAPSSVATRPSHPAVSTTPVAKGHRSIALVAFTGDQIPGYQVAEVPSGWVIQGGNPYALVIAPKGDPDTSIDSFLGKLVVMLQSRDASRPRPRASPIQSTATPASWTSKATPRSSPSSAPTAAGSSSRPRPPSAGTPPTWPSSPPASKS